MSSALETLRRDFGGDIIEPGGAEYESASRTVLASGSPAYVLRPGSVGDVQAGVRFAAGTGLVLSVRGGGHGFAGFGTNDGGVVIDLGRLADVEIIDNERHLVRIGGGATWGQVAAALAPHGLAISSGDTKSVGVGGLTLTGGIGWKVRKHGSGPGQRGRRGGGHGQRAGRARERGGEPGAVLGDPRWRRQFRDRDRLRLRGPPDDRRLLRQDRLPGSGGGRRAAGLGGLPPHRPRRAHIGRGRRQSIPGGPEAPVEIHVAFDGDDPELAARAIDPIRRLGTVTGDDVALQPYADTLADGTPPPPGIEVVLRSAFAGQESVPEVLRILAEAGASERSPFIAVRSVGGAVSRVPGDATAYAHRQAELMVVTTTAGPEPAVEAARPALDAIWARLAPHVSGAYANFLASATERGCRRDLSGRRPISGSRRSSVGTTPATCSPATTNIRPQ